jgi:hypothetical protein
MSEQGGKSMALFGIKEIKDFAENHDDERVRIMYQRFVESRSKQAQQHERILSLESQVAALVRLYKSSVRQGKIE